MKTQNQIESKSELTSRPIDWPLDAVFRVVWAEWSPNNEALQHEAFFASIESLQGWHDALIEMVPIAFVQGLETWDWGPQEVSPEMWGFYLA